MNDRLVDVEDFDVLPAKNLRECGRDPGMVLAGHVEQKNGLRHIGQRRDCKRSHGGVKRAAAGNRSLV